MAAPSPKAQKAARTRLASIIDDAENAWVIHYSSESFYDRTDGSSPRITSIALRRLSSGQTLSYSIHQMAERKRIPLDSITEKYHELEKLMLQEFYAHVGSHRGMKYLHWNMRDSNFGFGAIEHRFRVHGGTPVPIEDDKKCDLARIMIDIYGNNYIGNPRLEKLMDLNEISRLNFLGGAQEAEAFEKRDYVALHQSTLRKVDVIANLAERAANRKLKTQTSWWEMNGGSLLSLAAALGGYLILALIWGLIGLAGFVIGIVSLLPKA